LKGAGGGVSRACPGMEDKVIARISNISDDTKYWLIASALSLTIIAFVITTPGHLDVSNSAGSDIHQGLADRVPENQEPPSYDISGPDEYSSGEEVAYRDRVNNQNKDR
jgi:hypothetical protein